MGWGIPGDPYGRVPFPRKIKSPDRARGPRDIGEKEGINR